MLHSEGRSNSGIMYLHCTYILPCTTAALHYYGHHSSADFLMMWYVDHYWEKTLSLLCCIFFLTSLLVPDLCFVCFNIQLSFFLLLFSCGVFITILFLLFKLLSHWAQRCILDRFLHCAPHLGFWMSCFCSSVHRLGLQAQWETVSVASVVF